MLVYYGNNGDGEQVRQVLYGFMDSVQESISILDNT